MVYKQKAAAAQGGTPTAAGTTAEKPSEPTVSKTSTDNSDGTRTIGLSITGSEKTSEEKTKADVIVILDISGSMNTSAGAQRRLAAAKSALGTLADTLLTDGSDSVRMSLITFSTSVEDVHGFTSDNATFKGYYQNVTADGGTNWEEVLDTADSMQVRSDAATYVIFATDGEPTFRNTRGNYSNSALDVNDTYYLSHQMFGTGNSDDEKANYDAALAEARSIINNNKNFYTIGIGNGVADLAQFTTEAGAGSGHYFHATDGDSLTKAFEDIAQSIVTTLGYANVRMTDGIPSLVNLAAKTGTNGTDGFTYEMTDAEGNSIDVPDSIKTAKYDADTASVVWDFPEQYQLQDGVTYKVSFTVWPSQEALDHVAKLNNGTETYDSLADDVKAQIVLNASGTYELRTNDKDQNVKVKNSASVGDSVAVSGEDVTLDFGEVPNLALQDAEVTVRKDWVGLTPSSSGNLYKTGVNLTVSDGTANGVSKTMTLKGGDWSDTAHISIGLIDRSGQILENGHDFTLTEDGSLTQNWTFAAGTYRPMMISGVLTMLQKGAVDGAAQYTIDDNVYSAVSGDAAFTLTGTNTMTETSLRVTKVWDDKDNQDGLRPNSVEVSLLADDVDTGKTVTLTPNNNWSAEFSGLSLTDEDGKTITYSVKEEDVNGYTSTVTKAADSSEDAGQSFTITNKHIPATTFVSGTKTWSGDSTDTSTKRPDSITVRLHADGKEAGVKTVTADENGKWSYSFMSLPKYANGKEIQYTVTEDAVENYSTTIDGYDIHNTYKYGETSINVTKVWEDDENRDGIRPQSVTVHLYADGEDTGKTAVLGEINRWSAEFAGLDERDRENRTIQYTVEEDGVIGYTSEVSGDMSKGFTITNTHSPETITVSGTKTWDDGDNQDGKRPDAVTVYLFADGVEIDSRQATAENGWTYSFENLSRYRDGGTLIRYSVEEGDEAPDYTASVSGYDITNTYTPGKTWLTVTKNWNDNDDQDGIRPGSVTVTLYADGEKTDRTAVLSAGNSWTYTFDDLDEMKSGTAVRYTVEEDAVEGYQASYDYLTGNTCTVTNSHTPELVNISGEKTWDGGENARPDSITVRLRRNGEVIDSRTVTPDPETGSWTYSFGNLPKYENNGTLINYTVTEDALDGYSESVSGYDITNTYTPGRTSVTVSKNWEDDENRDGIRPGRVKVDLYADGEKTDKSVTLSTANSWTAAFTELDETTKEGVKITYTVREQDVKDGYISEVTGSAEKGYVISNIHDPETIDISGTKTWDDKDDQDGKRPESITVRLLANGQEVRTAEVTEKDEWKYSFEDLLRYEDGDEIVYTVTEDAVDGYTAKVDKKYNITNSYTPEETSITVTKRWEDNQDAARKRPESVTIYLLADGKKTGKTVTLNAENHWSAQFTGLAVNKAGKAIAYTVSEDQVPGYEVPVIAGDAVKGFTVTNTVTPEKKKEEPKESVKPSGGTGSNSTGSTTAATGNVRTGDTSNIALYVILMIGAAALLIVMTVRRSKKQ